MIETRATHEIVEAFLASRRALRRKPTTIKGYAWALHKLSARFPDALPSEDDLVNFFAEEEALRSFKAFFWRLRTFFEWVARHDLGANAIWTGWKFASTASPGSGGYAGRTRGTRRTTDQRPGSLPQRSIGITIMLMGRWGFLLLFLSSRRAESIDFRTDRDFGENHRNCT